MTDPESYPPCLQCGSTRGLSPHPVKGDDKIVGVGAGNVVFVRGDSVFCGTCGWPVDSRDPVAVVDTEPEEGDVK